MPAQRNILVTGASRGLGLTIVKTLLEHGYGVIALSRSIGPELEAILAANTELVHHVGCDLGDCEKLTGTWFQEKVCQGKKLHGMVSNAAVAYDDLITNLQLEPLKNSFNVNVMSPMLLTKLIIRHFLLDQTAGTIVHVSSISAHTGYKGLAMYAATKGAIESFSKNTAREWGARKIRSNCVVPGFMETEMSESLDDKQKNRVYSRTALKEATSLESVAQTIKFLLSEESQSITGQNIFVDSGTI